MAAAVSVEVGSCQSLDSIPVRSTSQGTEDARAWAAQEAEGGEAVEVRAMATAADPAASVAAASAMVAAVAELVGRRAARTGTEKVGAAVIVTARLVVAILGVAATAAATLAAAVAQAVVQAVELEAKVVG